MNEICLYVYLQVSESKVDKATGIFYKALQNIPWAKVRYKKNQNVIFPHGIRPLLMFNSLSLCTNVNFVSTQSLYMDGVQLLPERLQEFVDVMTEKELRLRLPLEELDILLEE